MNDKESDAPQDPVGTVPRKGMSRRHLLKVSARGAGLLGLAGVTGAALLPGADEKGFVWQIDPEKCTQCGRCATECVLRPSAVKCVHNYRMCGYCDLCFAYFDPVAGEPGTGAEDLLCPVDALKREHIEDIYYEYSIDQDLCIGCGKCVKGCGTSGNGSLYLQIVRPLCADCNECAIARYCPAEAVVRIPAAQAYLHKGSGA